jgi:C-terminal processing protease CtpA/Prc
MELKSFNPLAEIRGLDAHFTSLLFAAGISNIHELSEADPARLLGRLEHHNDSLNLVDTLPDAATVGHWILQAKDIDPLAVAHKALQERLGSAGQIFTLGQWKDYLEDIEPPSKGEMLFIVEQTLEVIEQMYVHLSMKRARRAINPGQALRLLRQKVSDELDHQAFHEEMLEILHSLGDIHTAYRLPPPYRHAVAFLPMLIQRCIDPDAADGDPNRERYIVTKTLWQPSPHLPLQPGDEIVSWNGVPIAEAVEFHGRLVEGSNPAAGKNFGMLYMTMRWLGASYQPHSPWVIWEYRTARGHVREIRLEWRIIVLNAGQDKDYMTRAQYLWFMFNPTDGEMPNDGAMNPSSQIGRATSLAIFAPHKDASSDERAASRARREETGRLAHSGGRRNAFRAHASLHHGPGSLEDTKRVVESQMASFFEAEIISHEGVQYGYIRIRAFPFSGPNEVTTHTHFVTEFRRLLSLMPENGLAIDVRGNPGGSTKNAEMLLQLLCPADIDPLTFQFLASPYTREITSKPANAAVFGKWAESVDLAVRTGALFSQGHPISDVNDINYWGQEYFAPVVLLTSATSYSAADFFSASFQDHEIGQIIGVDESTGGGGANVWFYREHLLKFLPDKEAVEGGAEWPQNINLQFAARLVQRNGRNQGVPIEEIGVRTPKAYRYQLTRKDLLESDVDLLRFAMKTLASQPVYDLNVFSETDAGGKPVIRISSLHIAWIDLLINGRMIESRDVTQLQTGQAEDLVFSLPDDLEPDTIIEIHGYTPAGKGSKRVARYKHRVTDEMELVKEPVGT